MPGPHGKPSTFFNPEEFLEKLSQLCRDREVRPGTDAGSSSRCRKRIGKRKSTKRTRRSRSGKHKLTIAKWPARRFPLATEFLRRCGEEAPNYHDPIKLFQRKLWHRNLAHHSTDKPGIFLPQRLSPHQKLEELLRLVKKIREQHLCKVAHMRNKCPSEVPANTDLNDDERTAVLEAWKKDFMSWMGMETKREYMRMVEHGRSDFAQRLLNKTFTACVFQVAGTKDLLYLMIQYPSLSHPAYVLRWLKNHPSKSS